MSTLPVLLLPSLRQQPENMCHALPSESEAKAYFLGAGRLQVESFTPFYSETRSSGLWPMGLCAGSGGFGSELRVDL